MAASTGSASNSLLATPPSPLTLGAMLRDRYLGRIYLGLSRYGLDQLIGAGKLRLSTVRSQHRGEKPEKLIPAKDLLALD